MRAPNALGAYFGDPADGSHSKGRRHRGRAVAILTALLGLAMAVAVGADPAAATHGRAYHDEDDMVNDTIQGNRDTFVFDPTPHQLLDRGQLLTKAGFYASYGFDENFLWYAPEKVEVIPQARTWATCEGGASHPGDLCASGHVRTDASHTIGHTFGGDTQLHVLEYGGAFIAQACGNFSTDGDAPTPTPSIEGSKFRDANRDGHRDPGEGPIAGWPIRITRIRSDAGQGTGIVANLATDGSGNYSFMLDHHGPGIYRVEELVPAGWQAYTVTSHDVAVGFGVGDHVYKVGAFGNAETTTDVAKTSFTLVDPPERLEKDQPAEFTVRSEVTNHGPAGPIGVDEELTVAEKPDDCIVDGLPPRRRRELDVGQSAVFEDVLTVTCSHRSDHRFVFRNDVSVGSPGEVVDVDLGNNSATIDVTIPVFEQTELAVDQLSIVCDEYWAPDPFTCSASARVTNAGAADDALLLATLTLAGSPGCTTVPDRLQQRPVVLDGGESQTVDASWSVSCVEPTLHTFNLDAAVRVDEPHLEAVPRTATLVWVPQDTKPNSDPNSLNIGRPGLVSIALLSTPDLDTATAVDQTSLTWGPTGFEAEVVRCGSPEDADGDGLLDLVCKFQLADADFTVGDTLGIVRGTLTDGRPFMSADQVRIV